MKVGSAGFFNSTPHGVTGTQPPRQKGRPRKRKPKDIESMTANLGKTKYKILSFARRNLHF